MNSQWIQIPVQVAPLLGNWWQLWPFVVSTFWFGFLFRFAHLLTLFSICTVASSCSLCTSHCMAMHCEEFRSVEARKLILHLWSAFFKFATWSSFHSYFLVTEMWTHLFHSVVLRFTYEATDWFNKHILSTSYRLYARSWGYMCKQSISGTHTTQDAMADIINAWAVSHGSIKTAPIIRNHTLWALHFCSEANSATAR